MKRSGMAAAALGALAVTAAAQCDPAVLRERFVPQPGSSLANALSEGDRFGLGIEYLGDLDGPGGSEYAVAFGARGDDGGGFDRGAIYVVFFIGTEVSGFHKIDETLDSGAVVMSDADKLGQELACIADLDGDGSPELLVGVQFDGAAGALAGAAYVLFLTPGGAVKKHVKLDGGSPGIRLGSGYRFGSSVGDLGLLSGGPPGAVRTVGIGAYRDPVGDTTGSVFLVWLDAAANPVLVSKIVPGAQIPSPPGGQFGSELANLGDPDGAGPVELRLAVGANSVGAQKTGSIWILDLGPLASVIGTQLIDETSAPLAGQLAPFDALGGAEMSGVDVDGDGATDLVVGIHEADVNGTNRGSLAFLCLDAAGVPVSFSRISELEGGLSAQLDDVDEFGAASAFAAFPAGCPHLFVSVPQDDRLSPTAPAPLGANYGGVYVLDLGERTLVGEPKYVPVATGGVHTWTLTPGAEHDGRIYLVLGSASGTSWTDCGGFPLGGGLELNLVPDAYTTAMLSRTNKAPYQGTLGIVGAVQSGTATASVTIPPGLTRFTGQTLHHAFVVFDLTLAVAHSSNPVPLVLVP